MRGISGIFCRGLLPSSAPAPISVTFTLPVLRLVRCSMSTNSCSRSFTKSCSSLTATGLSHLGHLGWRTDLVAVISLLATTQLTGDGAKSRWPKAGATRHPQAKPSPLPAPTLGRHIQQELVVAIGAMRKHQPRSCGTICLTAIIFHQHLPSSAFLKSRPSRSLEHVLFSNRPDPDCRSRSIRKRKSKAQSSNGS